MSDAIRSIKVAEDNLNPNGNCKICDSYYAIALSVYNNDVLKTTICRKCLKLVWDNRPIVK